MRYLFTLSLFVFLLLGTSRRAEAQGSLSLAFTSSSSTTPRIGSSLSVFTQLTNLSTTDTFNGIVNFSLANKDSIITNLSVVGYPPFAGTVIKLAPLEHRSALFTIQIVPSYFKVGPDIIIVWPLSSVPVVDSARAPIDILPALGIGETANDGVQMFVANGQLVIHNTGAKMLLQQVQIFDLIGKEIRSWSGQLSDQSFSLDGLPDGTYIAQIRISEGDTRRLRFVK